MYLDVLTLADHDEIPKPSEATLIQTPIRNSVQWGQSFSIEYKTPEEKEAESECLW